MWNLTRFGHRPSTNGEYPVLQKLLVPAGGYCGVSPYPWFKNVGSTCYINTVFHCLFHCARSREYFLAMEQNTDMRAEVAKLAIAYTLDLPPCAPAPARKWDVLIPHKLIDAIDETSRLRPDHFDFGRQHDAAELLAFVMESTGVGTACFQATHPHYPSAAYPRRHEDVLLLDSVGASSIEEAILREESIDMKRFLV